MKKRFFFNWKASIVWERELHFSGKLSKHLNKWLDETNVMFWLYLRLEFNKYFMDMCVYMSRADDWVLPIAKVIRDVNDDQKNLIKKPNVRSRMVISPKQHFPFKPRDKLLVFQFMACCKFVCMMIEFCLFYVLLFVI